MGARRGLGPDCWPDAAERVHARVDPGGVRAGSAHMDAPRQLGTWSACGARSGGCTRPGRGAVFDLHRGSHGQSAPVVRPACGVGPDVHRRRPIRAVSRGCRRARIRALCPPLAVRGDQRRRGNIRACGGDPRGTALRHSIRHLPPVQPRAAAAGRRLHVDRTCDGNDVPDLHMAGDRANPRERPSSSPSRLPCFRRWQRRCSTRGVRSSEVDVTENTDRSRTNADQIGHGQTRIRSVTDYADVHGQEDFRVVCVEPQRPGVVRACKKSLTRNDRHGYRRTKCVNWRF